VTSVFARTFYRFVGGNTTIPVTLGLRNIYILPTGYGLLYLTVLAAMLAGSVNYNNNLGFLLTFLLGSLGLTAMMHTYAMLYGLRLTAVRAMPAFAGTHVEIEISVAGIRRPRTGIRWFFNPVDSIVANFNPDEPARVLVRVISDHRGLFDPGWLRIACEYPLGLFHAWARVSADWNCLVYPRPVAGPVPVAKALSDSGAGDISRAAGVDDFQGLFAYQPGDSPGRIHWQSYLAGTRAVHQDLCRPSRCRPDAGHEGGQGGGHGKKAFHPLLSCDSGPPPAKPLRIAAGRAIHSGR
jgi:uncharacterized protein (DUF58 family)